MIAHNIGWPVLGIEDMLFDLIRLHGHFRWKAGG